jgi:hypothetical protein
VSFSDAESGGDMVDTLKFEKVEATLWLYWYEQKDVSMVIRPKDGRIASHFALLMAVGRGILFRKRPEALGAVRKAKKKRTEINASSYTSSSHHFDSLIEDYKPIFET